MNDTDWPKLASTLLKTELVRRNITYAKLAVMLDTVGVHETEESIKSKFTRGTFQFAFFLQCAKAIGLNQLRLDDI